MIQHIVVYARDGQKVSLEQWLRDFYQDWKADGRDAQELTDYDVEDAVIDLDGKPINGHTYSYNIYCDHDNVQELMESLTEFEYQNEIFEAVKKMPDDIIHRIVLAIESPAPVTFVDGKYRV